MDLVFAPSQIETWPIARLRPYARNAKMHGDDQVAKIAASMAKFGWTVPCMVADDGELIAGHGRVLAATMLGLTEVPVIRLSHLDEAERRAYRIADNKLTELGEWDEALLRDEIAGLLAEDFDLSLLGISDDDLDALLRDPEALGGDGPVEGEDDVPELPVTPVSVPGDLWQLGAHRLICGDSTAADVVGRLLGDVRPLLMVTDPPYGVEYDPSWRNHAGAAKTTVSGGRSSQRATMAIERLPIPAAIRPPSRMCRIASRRRIFVVSAFVAPPSAPQAARMTAAEVATSRSTPRIKLPLSFICGSPEAGWRRWTRGARGRASRRACRCRSGRGCRTRSPR